MKISHSFTRAALLSAGALFVAAPLSMVALDFSLSATTTLSGKRDLGAFNAGEAIALTFTGDISLIDGWDTYADGSLANPVTIPGFEYANAGATDYPTGFGGDGINHFPGGGANFDAAIGGATGFGQAGALTTDTTMPGVIRFGSVVATFKSNPGQFDWFALGLTNYFAFTNNGVHLYVAVHDTTYGNNSRSYASKLTFLTPRLQNARTYAGFEIDGEAGQNYRIDYTPAVLPVNWQTLTNIVLPYTPYLLIDTSGPATGQRFYRAVKTP